MVVEQFYIQIVPKLEKYIRERLKFKRGERLYRVTTFVAKPVKRRIK